MNSFSGMSLRDYFAAHCPSDLAKVNNWEDTVAIAGPQPEEADGIEKMVAWNNKIEAFLRYNYADAMLAEREKTQ